EQDDVAVLMDGDDGHGAGMLDDAERGAAAVGEDHVPVDEPDDASPEDFLLGLNPEFHAAVNCSPNRSDYKTSPRLPGARSGSGRWGAGQGGGWRRSSRERGAPTRRPRAGTPGRR